MVLLYFSQQQEEIGIILVLTKQKKRFLGKRFLNQEQDIDLNSLKGPTFQKTE